jgi:hypothetical protein
VTTHVGTTARPHAPIIVAANARELLRKLPGFVGGSAMSASAPQLNRLPEIHVDESCQVVAEVADCIVRNGKVDDILNVLARKRGLGQLGIHYHLIKGVSTVLGERLD